MSPRPNPAAALLRVAQLRRAGSAAFSAHRGLRIDGFRCLRLWTRTVACSIASLVSGGRNAVRLMFSSLTTKAQKTSSSIRSRSTSSNQHLVHGHARNLRSLPFQFRILAKKISGNGP